MTAAAASWIDVEPPLPATARAVLTRLVQRSRASWPVWLVAALLGAAVLTYKTARTPPVYSVTAVLRVTEGAVRTPAGLSQGALQDHVKGLTFSRARLGEVMKRHPREFGYAQDPDGAYEGMRERISLEISEDDLIGGGDEDPPRSAHITLGFQASQPELAWTVTHELADLLIDSELAQERAALRREQAGAESAVEEAEAHVDDRAVAGMEAVHTRLQAADERAARARIAARAAEQGQSLRFELVDPGRMPAIAGKRALVTGFFTTFAALLVAAALLAGAFDPRVLGADDLEALRIPLLGELPPLPHVRSSQAPKPATEQT
jgi:hypothetical protein